MRPREMRRSDSRACQLGLQVGEFGFQLRHAPRRIELARLSRIKLRPPVDVFAMQAIDVRLKSVAPVLVIAQLLASQFQAAFKVLDLIRERAHLGANGAQCLLALDDAGVRIRIARQPQPIRTQPHSVARDHRFARAQDGAAL